MRVYISGPMTGYPEFNYPEFHRVADEWRKLGHDVFCPAENFNGRQDLPWEFYMKEDLRLVMHCDAIVVLPFWWHSRGALIEVLTAITCGLPVFYKTGEEIEITYREIGESLREWGKTYEHSNQREDEVGEEHPLGVSNVWLTESAGGLPSSTVEAGSSSVRVGAKRPGSPARLGNVRVREGYEPIRRSVAVKD